MHNRARPFFRARADAHANLGGFGLGLILGQRAVRSDGGRIALSHRPEGGVLARVELTREGQAEAAAD